MAVPPDAPMEQDVPDQDQPVVADQPEPQALLETPEPAPTLEIAPEPSVDIPIAEPAPLVAPSRDNQVLGLPLQLLNQLLARLGSAPLHNLADLLPALRLLALLLLAGFVLKLTGATLEALNEIPMLGRLLELVGLISALNFLARNALRSQKRAELLTRIQKLKQQFLG